MSWLVSHNGPPVTRGVFCALLCSMIDGRPRADARDKRSHPRSFTCPVNVVLLTVVDDTITYDYSGLTASLHGATVEAREHRGISTGNGADKGKSRIFTELHEMQTRTSDENSVCLSDRLPDA